MKRITVVLMLLLTVLSVPSFAADLDLSSMTDLELTDLRADIDKELASRNVDESYVIPSGFYEVGVDLIDGKFMAYPIDENIGMVIFGDTREEAEEVDENEWYFAKQDDPAPITLDKGEWLHLPQKTLLIKASSESFPWMPKTDE